jgi:hypothetical protein
MSIQNLLSKNKEIYDKLYPPALRVLIDNQKKLKASLLLSDQLKHLSNSIKHLPSLIIYSAAIEKISNKMVFLPLFACNISYSAVA